METYRLPYGPNGKAKLSIGPPYRGVNFFKSKIIKIYNLLYQFIGAPMETYRLPYGPNGKAELPIGALWGGLIFSMREL